MSHGVAMGILRRLDDNRWFRHAHISVDYRLWLALTEVRMLFIGGSVLRRSRSPNNLIHKVSAAAVLGAGNLGDTMKLIRREVHDDA